MKRRQGFTLVELLVAMALIMFMMAILSQAFVQSTGVFRNLKAEGDMAEKLRATTQLLQRDLSADHFEGKKRLSDPTFWQNGPPQQGFFQIYQGSAPSTTAGSPCYIEGAGPDGIDSYRSINHTLAFTIKLRGNQMSNFLTAGTQGGGLVLGALTDFGPLEARYQHPITNGFQYTYKYQWAEVAWFLQRQASDVTATDLNTGAPGLPLYTLYRHQRLLVPDNSLVTTVQPAGNSGNFLEVSCWPNGTNLYFNGPMDITVPARRFGGGVPTGFTTFTQEGGGPSGVLTGADIQMTNVVSFDVRMLVAGMTTIGVDPFVTLWEAPFDTLNTASGINNGNPTYYPANPAGAMVFDTWSSIDDALSNYSSVWSTAGNAMSIPLWHPSIQSGPIVLAIQISMRIWDEKTNQTRQVTIVQAM